jgi:alanine racemase
MTVRLTIDRERWLEHVEETMRAFRGIAQPVPVVKGNGYGLGRSFLAEIAAGFDSAIAVGTVHELDGLPPDVDIRVLTPTLAPFDRHTLGGRVVLTVGSSEHIAAIAGSRNRVIVKLETSMHRYGAGYELVDEARAADLEVIGVSIHPTLATSESDRRAEAARLLADERLTPDLYVWLSHLAPVSLLELPHWHPHRFHLRMGTELWHGDRGALQLTADVLQVRAVTAGTPVGYRQNPVPGDGHLVMVGAGTANGVHPLHDGRSPFHFRRRRLDLIEPPHMHTSMLFVPAGVTPPPVGEHIDLQRPLSQTDADEIIWH